MVNEFRLSRNQIAQIVGNDPEAIRAFERLVSIAKTTVFSEGDRAKLDGIEAGAQVNVPTDLSYIAGSRVLASSTGADATLPLFTAANAGLAPNSGGGSVNYLRADGVWSTPAGGGGSQVLAMLGL
jgi:hypothetical protein